MGMRDARGENPRQDMGVRDGQRRETLSESVGHPLMFVHSLQNHSCPLTPRNCQCGEQLGS